jgi:chaperonin GroEL (HSP60 family)
VYYQFLDEFKQPAKLDRATLINVAHTSLATKLNAGLAKQLAADVVDAVITIRPPAPSKGTLPVVWIRGLALIDWNRRQRPVAESY